MRVVVSNVTSNGGFVTWVQGYLALVGLGVFAFLIAAAEGQPAVGLVAPPPGFSSATAHGLHYVRGGRGPAVILVHDRPGDWVEGRAILECLSKRFTVDLPGRMIR